MKDIYGKKCLLDTNIILAARIRTDPHHIIATKIFEDIEKNIFAPFLSIQNVLEFSAVLTRVYKLSSREAARDIELIFSLPRIQVLYPTVTSRNIFIQLLSSYPNIYVFDLYLAATAISFGIDIILSNGNDFAGIKEIEFHNPFQGK